MLFILRKNILSKNTKFSSLKIIRKYIVFKKTELFKFIFFLLIFRFLNTFKDKLKRKSFDEFKPHKVFIEAHRGVNREKFQNTKESIELAIKYGLDSFETDLWLSNDNVGVLAHGYGYGDIRNVYNTSSQLIHTNYSELSTLHTIKDNSRTPKFEDIIKLTKNKIFMNIEIKDPRIDLVFSYLVNLLDK